MMQPDRSSLGSCIKLRKIYDDMMTPGQKSCLAIRVDPSPSVTSHIKVIFWLQVSSYIGETGYMMQLDRSSLATCIKMCKMNDNMMTPS